MQKPRVCICTYTYNVHTPPGPRAASIDIAKCLILLGFILIVVSNRARDVIFSAINVVLSVCFCYVLLVI